MKFPIRKGSTIACGDRRYLECSKLSKSKRHGWTGVGYDFAKNESFRVWTSQWYPIGTILVTECAIDVDLFCIDTERTLDANAFPLDWLAANEPKGPEIQLELSLWNETT